MIEEITISILLTLVRDLTFRKLNFVIEIHTLNYQIKEVYTAHSNGLPLMAL